MRKPRTLKTLLLAATVALLVGVQPAAAAPAAPATTRTVEITASPLLNLSLFGDCPDAKLTQVVAMQRINWMWAPIGLDYVDGSPLPMVLRPYSMILTGDGVEAMRARHNLVPGVSYTSGGPRPTNPVRCVFWGRTSEGAFELTVVGSLVTIPKWLDALLPPIPVPPKV